MLTDQTAPAIPGTALDAATRALLGHRTLGAYLNASFAREAARVSLEAALPDVIRDTTLRAQLVHADTIREHQNTAGMVADDLEEAARAAEDAVPTGISDAADAQATREALETAVQIMFSAAVILRGGPDDEDGDDDVD